jgi:hypothetical protein
MSHRSTHSGLKPDISYAPKTPAQIERQRVTRAGNEISRASWKDGAGSPSRKRYSYDVVKRESS